jgi:hypothetical protein
MTSFRLFKLSFLLLTLTTAPIALGVSCEASKSGLIGVSTALLLWASSSEIGVSSTTDLGNRVPTKDDETPGVAISTDKQRYRIGEPIWVSIKNARQDTVYLPAGSNMCSIVGVYRLEDGQWVAQDRCPTSAALAKVPIPKGSQIRGILGHGKASDYMVGPIVGPVTAPQTFEGDVKDLPKVPPWQPGDPTWEVPRGRLLPNDRRPPFDALASRLGEGRYQIRTGYTIGPAPGSAEKVVAAEFQISR